jgi:tetratricopeptide (TPR) repeat protein
LDSADSQLRSVPAGGRLVAKKDVQLFSLWHAQEVLGRRRDAEIIAEGLSGADWYRAGMSREYPPLVLTRLSQPENWPFFLAANGSAFATMDAEWPPDLPSSPRGLAVLLSTASESPDLAARMDLVCLRGPLRYDEQRDFFSSDLVADYSAGWQRAGYESNRAGMHDEAYRRFALAWAAKALSPEAPLYMGLIRFKQGRDEDARRLFALASKTFDDALALGRAYRVLPAVTGMLAKESATALLNWGAAEERLGRRDEAIERYEQAAARDPSLGQAHFNLAVMYWNRDWARARSELAATLKLEPGNVEAARYLAQLPALQRVGK